MNYTAYLRHRLNRFDSTIGKKTVYRWQDFPKQRMSLKVQPHTWAKKLDMHMNLNQSLELGMNWAEALCRETAPGCALWRRWEMVVDD